MIAVIGSVRIQPEHVSRFSAAASEYARGALRDEPGCHQYDLVQDQEDETRFHTFEVYDDEAAFQAHLSTALSQRFAPTVQECLAEPPNITRGHLLV